jgi:hypothetical protein
VPLYLIPVRSLAACLPYAFALAAVNRGTLSAVQAVVRQKDDASASLGEVRSSLRMLAAFGLVRRTGEHWALTESGRLFADSLAGADQSEVALDALIEDGSPELRDSLVAALSLVGSNGFESFEDRLAQEAGWTSETAGWQGPRYFRLLSELSLLDEAGAVTDEAAEFTAMAKVLAAERTAQPADDDEIHLILKWSEKHGARTIEAHLDIVQAHGEVWWAIIGRQDRRKLGQRWRDLLERQLEAGTTTYAYIAGPTCWKTEIVDIADDQRSVDPELVGASGDAEYSLWVKLADFHPVERSWLTEHLDFAASAGAPVTEGALGNQTNPMIVRRAGDRRARTRRVWWVNQGQTFDAERELGILWAPKVARDGSVREFWRALEDAAIGDLVLHYVNGAVRAVSEVSDVAVDAPRPDGPDTRDGWLVHTNYRDLDAPVPLEHINVEARRAEEGPFARAGGVLQGYFFPLSDRFVNELALEHPELGLQPEGDTALLDYAAPSFAAIETELHSSGLRLDDRTLRRYHASLNTRGFVILAGISGGGKTWLAEAYARAIGAVSLVVPVAPNWTSNEDLIGFAPALGGEYRHTGFSKFLLSAAAEHADATAAQRDARPYHLILDEMNLARVEYYFAKFLSAMEQRSRDDTATIFLSEELSVPLTPNLKFVGTVNVDETTFSFADKVYDRAQLIEIEVSRELFADYLAEQEHGETLLAIWDAVRPVAPFAFRVAKDIDSYINEAQRLDATWEQALDDQLLQKVLPKLRGADPKLETALKALSEIASDRFPLTQRKVEAMLEDYEVHGLVSFF